MLLGRATESPYALDLSLGLQYFITDTRGIGGRLRYYAEDFFVEELPKTFPVSEDGEYVHFTLEKKNWETIAAVRSIAGSLGVSFNRFGYAGSKDKRALTRQRVAVWGVRPERLMEIKIEGIRVYDLVRSDSRLCLGDLEGNRFRVSVRGLNLRGEELEQALEATRQQIEASGVPNYYGYQRFGTIRPNTHLVGKELVHENLEGAVMAYLGSPQATERRDAHEARLYLDETRDYRGALRLYPKRLTYERAMLDALARNCRDYAGAIRRLPKKLGRLLVQAYQSYLFNRMLSAVVEAGMDIKNLLVPLIGFRSEIPNSPERQIVENVLDHEGVTPRNFFIQSIPELSSEGTVRKASVDVRTDSFIRTGNAQEGNLVTFEFCLPPGSYATTVLREFMKAEPLFY